MKVHKLVFIGAGNMAEALIKGLIAQNVIAAKNITATDVRADRLAEMAQRFGIATSQDNCEAVAMADAIVLAVKPQQMADVLAGLKPKLPKTALVISIAAGKTSAMFESALGEGTRVVRVMPNTPALVGAGAAAIARGRWATDDDLALTEELLGAVGIVVRTEELMMDAVTALSGSGPAYVFYLAEAMLEAAQRMGMDAAVAKQLAVATIGGAARLMAESSEPPSVLRERVTSKGGTTAAALSVMNDRNVFNAVVDALLAASARSRELSA
jgi:pyrroline-5-carboxylate reductase